MIFKVSLKILTIMKNYYNKSNNKPPLHQKNTISMKQLIIISKMIIFHKRFASSLVKIMINKFNKNIRNI